MSKIKFEEVETISISKDQSKKVKKLADKKFNGNFSAAIRSLIDKIK